MVSMRHNYYIHSWVTMILSKIYKFLTGLLHQSACIVSADTASKGNFLANTLGHLSVEPVPPMLSSTKDFASLKALNAGVGKALLFESRH